jgi:hypothetical protein
MSGFETMETKAMGFQLMTDLREKLVTALFFSLGATAQG